MKKIDVGLDICSKRSKGSITSWIDNKKAYEDLPDEIKAHCHNVRFTCGLKKVVIQMTLHLKNIIIKIMYID